MDDPGIESFYHIVWEETADRNTAIFDRLFSPLPSATVSTLRESKEVQSEKQPVAETFVSNSRQKLKEIKGHLVRYPLNYLCQEDLQPSALAKEGMVPSELWK